MQLLPWTRQPGEPSETPGSPPSHGDGVSEADGRAAVPEAAHEVALQSLREALPGGWGGHILQPGPEGRLGDPDLMEGWRTLSACSLSGFAPWLFIWRNRGRYRRYVKLPENPYKPRCLLGCRAWPQPSAPLLAASPPRDLGPAPAPEPSCGRAPPAPVP